MKIMKKILIVFFGVILMAANLEAQVNWQQVVAENAKSKTFEEIAEIIDNLYEGQDKGRGSGYKQYGRWKYFNSTRLDSNGKLMNVTLHNWNEFYNNNLDDEYDLKAYTYKGNWFTLGPQSYTTESGWLGGIGRVNRVAGDPTDPNIIYACTPAGGLWRLYKNTHVWECLTDGMPRIGAMDIAIRPSSPVGNRTIYMLTGDGDGSGMSRIYSIGVLVSFDNGINWHGTGLRWGMHEKMIASRVLIDTNDENKIYVATNQGIYYSFDGGITWNQNNSNNNPLLNGNEISDMEFKPDNTNILYATTRSGNFYTIDCTTLSNNLNISVFTSGTRIGVSLAEPDAVYLMCGKRLANTGRFDGIYFSADSGSTFGSAPRSTTPNILGYSKNGDGSRSQSSYDLAIAISPNDIDSVIIGGINCFSSSDGGRTWDWSSHWYQQGGGYVPDKYVHGDIHDLKYIHGALYVASDGGVSVSYNNGDTWSDLSVGLNIHMPYKIDAHPTVPNLLTMGTQDNGTNLIETVGSVIHWIGDDGGSSFFDENSTTRMFGCTQFGNGLYVSSDAGRTHSQLTKPVTLEGEFVIPFILEPGTSNNLYIGYEDVWFSSTGGTGTWTNISQGTIGSNNCRVICMAPSNSNVIYVSKGSTLYRGVQSGGAWTFNNAGAPGSNTITSIEVNPNNENFVWITYGGIKGSEKVYYTINAQVAGTSNVVQWRNFSNSLPNVSTNAIVSTAGSEARVFLGTDVGVFYRDTNDLIWTEFNSGLPRMPIFDLDYNDSEDALYAGSFGRGVWKTFLNTPCHDYLSFSSPFFGFKSYNAHQIDAQTYVKAQGQIELVSDQIINLNQGFSAFYNDTVTFSAMYDRDACIEANPYLKSGEQEVELKGFFAGPMPGIDKDAVVLDGTNNLYATPNPFKATSAVHFYVEKDDTPVTITITNAIGAPVKHLAVDKIYDGGMHVVDFDLGAYPDGIYFCVIKEMYDVRSIKLLKAPN